ncbi:MAG TPA: permease prefix domain 1-containing protein [Trueperaceae bacterium]
MRAEPKAQEASVGAPPDSIEGQIEAWRAYLSKGGAVSSPDAEELEDHLREQIERLRSKGLSPDEAFLVAVKRIGAIDAITREYAREHSERLWKQLVLSGNGSNRSGSSASEESRSTWVALTLAFAAAAAMKAPALFGIEFSMDEAFYPLNATFLVFPFVAAYFAWERGLPRLRSIELAGALVAAALLVNAFPFSDAPGAQTRFLTVIHLPIALWLFVGVAYVGGGWSSSGRRMDFIRFTGELFIYFVLIALGGGVLIALVIGLFQAIGVEAEPFVESWLAPCGAAGAAVIASWLVEAKQSVIENIAPVLARIFAPLFTLMLLAFIATMAWTGQGIDVGREILIAFDLLLVVVFGLLLYSVSARDPLASPGLLDWIHLTLVVSALLLDALALWAIGARISDFGFTANRVAALGLNLVLLVNLARSALVYVGFLRGTVAFSQLWEWQTSYLQVFVIWAAIVAFAFPVLFRFS